MFEWVLAKLILQMIYVMIDLCLNICILKLILIVKLMLCSKKLFHKHIKSNKLNFLKLNLTYVYELWEKSDEKFL